MKSTPAFLTSLGLNHAGSQALLLAHVLRASTVSSPAFVVRPAVAASGTIPFSPAIVAPAIVAPKGWEDAIQIVKTPELIEIIAYLPYATNPQLIGAPFTKSMIKEITPPNLVFSQWLDETGGGNTQIIYPFASLPSLEQMLYDTAERALTNCIITDVVRTVGVPPTPCKKLVFSLPAVGYDPNSGLLQLSKLTPLAGAAS
jgi:hypothetical protein